MSLLSRNVAGQTKKSVSTASLFLAWAVGNMIGPQVFQSKDAPRYFTCFSVHMGCYGCIIILLGILRWHLRCENIKRDLLQVMLQIFRYYGWSSSTDLKLQEEDWRASEANLGNAFDDLTDKENLSFRYRYWKLSWKRLDDMHSGWVSPRNVQRASSILFYLNAFFTYLNSLKFMWEQGNDTPKPK